MIGQVKGLAAPVHLVVSQPQRDDAVPKTWRMSPSVPISRTRSKASWASLDCTLAKLPANEIAGAHHSAVGARL